MRKPMGVSRELRRADKVGTRDRRICPAPADRERRESSTWLFLWKESGTSLINHSYTGWVFQRRSFDYWIKITGVFIYQLIKDYNILFTDMFIFLLTCSLSCDSVFSPVLCVFNKVIEKTYCFFLNDIGSCSWSSKKFRSCSFFGLRGGESLLSGSSPK